MKTIEEILALNVRSRLQKLGWTQRDLAQITGLTEQSVSKLLNGRSSRRLNQEAIAKALGCSRQDLLKTKNIPPPTVESLLEVISKIQKENETLKKSAMLQSLPQDVLSWVSTHDVDDDLWDKIRAFLGIPLAEKKSHRISRK